MSKACRHLAESRNHRHVITTLSRAQVVTAGATCCNASPGNHKTALVLYRRANNPPIAAAASSAAVQQVQTPIKFDVPVFEGDIAASWLTWSQKSCIQD